MNEARLLEHGERVQQLRGEHLDELRAEALELVLLDQLVQVGREQLENETQVVFVDERVPQSENVVLVMWIALLVELLREVNLEFYCKFKSNALAPVLSLPSYSD